jgi:hypothetical protein
MILVLHEVCPLLYELLAMQVQLTLVNKGNGDTFVRFLTTSLCFNYYLDVQREYEYLRFYYYYQLSSISNYQLPHNTLSYPNGPILSVNSLFRRFLIVFSWIFLPFSNFIFLIAPFATSKTSLDSFSSVELWLKWALMTGLGIYMEFGQRGIANPIL